MDGKEAIKTLAKRLLEAAGGDPANASEYYAVVCGGADDIVGMVICELQLERWKELSELVYGELCSRAYDDPKAYGIYCYSMETLNTIVEGLALTVMVVPTSPCDVRASVLLRGVI